MGQELKDYAFLPIRHPSLIAYYDKQMNMSWKPSEVPFSNKDRVDWDSLSEGERKVLTFVLAFFAQFDGIVAENIEENFTQAFGSIKEVVYVYSQFNAMEVIHNQTYSLLIFTFISDEAERNKALRAIQNYPQVGAIMKWLQKTTKDCSDLERLIAFACLEGIVFSSAFAVIYYFKRKSKLVSLTTANEWIARDEALHTEFAIALYKFLTSTKRKEPVSKEKVHQIISSCINEACEPFIREALSLDLIGLSADDMMTYVKCTANSLSTSLGFEKIYDCSNPFDWMLVISLDTMTNFFENRVTAYGTSNQSSSTLNTLSTVEDF